MTRPSFGARALLVAVAGYRRFVSPLLPPACRFEPTCSVYAAEAIRLHGARRGAALALRRLARCRPGRPGGYDPPPLSAPDPPRGASSGAAPRTRR